MKTKYLIIAAAALTLTACSSTDSQWNADGVLPADGSIKVYQAGVSAPVTRAGQATTYNNQNFGLFVTNSADAAYTYSDVCMRYESGAWKSYASAATDAAAQLMLWQSADQPVTVTAYTPYDATATADGTLTGSVQTDQTAEGNDILSDVLYARADVTPSAEQNTANAVYYNATSKALAVKMGHRLSKVRVNLTITDEFPQGGSTPVSGMTLGGTNTAWQMSMADGTVSAATTAVTAGIRMKQEATAQTGYHATFESIVVPQTASLSLSLILPDRAMVYTGASRAMESDKLYTLNLRVGKELQLVGDVTVSDWGAGSSTDVHAQAVITNPQLIAILKDQGVTVDEDGFIYPADAAVKAQLDKITELKVSNKGLTSLDGIQYLKNLQFLSCYYNQLSSLDVSKNTSLTNLNCDNNQLSSLDVSKNTSLQTLYCHSNQLSSLDVSKNTSLTDLYCHSNQLSSLDVSKNTSLTNLSCHSNQLSSLEVSKNTSLKGLDCRVNQLSSLDVSKNTSLTDLSCGLQKDANGNAQTITVTLTSAQNTALNPGKYANVTTNIVSGAKRNHINK